jgi:hypothetical protein
MAKRESNRLGPISAAWLAPGAYEAYKQYCVERGQREGQFKTIALAYQYGFGFDLEAHTERFANDSEIDSTVLAFHSI